MSVIPLVTDLRARPCDLFTRDMVRPPGRASGARAVLAGAHSPCPDPGVRIPLSAAERSVNTQRPPPPRRGGAALARTYILRLLSRTEGKARRAKGLETR